MKEKYLPEWNCCLTYFEPTKVMYKGEVCTVRPGTNNKPEPLPKMVPADALIAELEGEK